jgi:hypothetical protein
MVPDEEWSLGVFDTSEEALEAAKRLVDDSLRENWKPGMTPAVLFLRYQTFGDDPAIYVEGGGDGAPPFSAWTYAESRAVELCATLPTCSP